MSFGVGCGMHRITLNPTFNQYEATILPPPANIAEMVERINVFSGVFQVSQQTGSSYTSPRTLTRGYDSDRTSRCHREWRADCYS